MTSLETKLHEALAEIDFYQRVNSELKTEITRLRLLAAQTNLEERIAKLPPASQERLRKAFPGTDMGGSKQAVSIELEQNRKGQNK